METNSNTMVNKMFPSSVLQLVYMKPGPETGLAPGMALLLHHLILKILNCIFRLFCILLSVMYFVDELVLHRYSAPVDKLANNPQKYCKVLEYKTFADECVHLQQVEVENAVKNVLKWQQLHVLC